MRKTAATLFLLRLGLGGSQKNISGNQKVISIPLSLLQLHVSIFIGCVLTAENGSFRL